MRNVNFVCNSLTFMVEPHPTIVHCVPAFGVAFERFMGLNVLVTSNGSSTLISYLWSNNWENLCEFGIKAINFPTKFHTRMTAMSFCIESQSKFGWRITFLTCLRCLFLLRLIVTLTSSPITDVWRQKEIEEIPIGWRKNAITIFELTSVHSCWQQCAAVKICRGSIKTPPQICELSWFCNDTFK